MIDNKTKLNDSGIVYVLTNKSMPGLVKIGKTKRDIQLRLRDLQSSGVPTPFECYYAKRFDNYSEIEKIMHDIFLDIRPEKNREFFRINPERVVSALKFIPGEEITETINNECTLDDFDEIPVKEANKKKTVKKPIKKKTMLNIESFDVTNMIVYDESTEKIIDLILKDDKICMSLNVLRVVVGYSSDFEYFAPNTTHPDYKQWNNDAIVYSLFNVKSRQDASSNVNFKGEDYGRYIKNEFFWLSRKEMLTLSKKHHFKFDKDISNGDRFICKELQHIKLSPDAQSILDKATKLVENSFKFREEMYDWNNRHFWGLKCWDASWYQLKPLIREKIPEDLKEFKKLWRPFDKRMREGVYKFGFLRE